MLQGHIRRFIASTDICIVGYGRSAAGQFGGVFKPISGVNMASQVCEGILSKFKIPKDQIDSSYIGLYLASSQGVSSTKQVAAKIGLSPGINCTYVNKLCASGIKAVILGVTDLMAQHSKLVLAGGVDHMTEALFSLPKEEQKNTVTNHFKCQIENKMLAEIADDFAKAQGISREEQDSYCLQSLDKALKAKELKKLSDVIIPVNVGEAVVADDEIKDFRNKVRTIRSLYGGPQTIINTAPFGDLAAYVILCTRVEAEALGLKVLASFISMGEHEITASQFLIGHYVAMEKALNRARLQLSDINLFEIAETFGSIPIVTIRDFKLDVSKVNIYGGDLVYTHPPGSTGCKILISLLAALKNEQKEIGMMAMPGACGGGTAVIIRNEQ